MEHPLVIVLLIAGAGWLFNFWLRDLRLARRGAPNPRALPGAVPAGGRAVAIAVAGALLILGGETLAELGLGTSGEQSTLTALLAVYTLFAAFLEEVVFRGYIVVTGRGAAVTWGAAAAASLVFALAHPFLWKWDGGGFRVTVSAQPLVSTVSVFATSLWLYAMRFWKGNPGRSLVPCVAAHLARNAAVIAIKGVQGHLGGWW
ncbi:MAG: CPBP family intramembrane metalloprotease [Opitutaceae bacterium]|nr:CPBP family intramembrane metalloprotease [Opitutaceae bacterium]